MRGGRSNGTFRFEVSQLASRTHGRSNLEYFVVCSVVFLGVIGAKERRVGPLGEDEVCFKCTDSFQLLFLGPNCGHDIRSDSRGISSLCFRNSSGYA